MPTLQIKKRRNNQRKRGKTRIFFESLEERLPVSASILGAVAGSLFLSESRQESQSVSSVVSSETVSEIISHVNSAEGILQESSNTFTTGKLKSFVTENLFSTDFLLGEDTVSEDELSTVARSSIANRSANDSVTTAILENDFSSVWSFLSEDDPNALTRQFADDLLLQQTSEANQSTLTSERPLHFSALPPLPIEAVAAPIYVGIVTASGGGGVSTTSDVSETSQSAASSQTILVGDFSQLSQTSSSSISSYGDVYFAYAAVSDGGYNSAYTNYNTNPNTPPTVQVETVYVFQTGNTATVMTEIWGAPVWEYVPYSIEILDPGTYWGNNISVSGTEFYLPDSTYITDYFTWTKPSGLDNDDPDIDRDFTFRFTVADLEPVDLNVHIAWAEVQVQFAGEGDFKTTSSNDTQSEDNTIVVGQKVKTKIDYDPVMTISPVNTLWSYPTGGSIVEGYTTKNYVGLINELTTIERYASQIQYYYTNTANNSFHGTGGVSVSFTATDPNNHSHSLSRNASYYIEKPDATLSASQTSTRLVDKDNDGVADYMELSSTTADGITFSASATAPTINGVGEVNFLQTLIEQTDRTGAGLQAQEMSSHNISVLDTQFPYGNPDYDTDPSFTGWTVGAGQTINSISSTPLATVDSPDQSFDNIVPNTNNYTTYSINDPFTMYLIYKPNGVGSIWIPLIAISWNWTVTAQWQLDTSDNTYKWMITSDTSNTEANGHAVTSLPQWTQNVNTILIAGWKNKQ